MSDEVAKPLAWCRDFVIKQKCIPWKLRLCARQLLPWKFRRFLTLSKINPNRPEDMDRRYANIGDDYISMANLYGYIIPIIAEQTPEAGNSLDVGCGIAVLMRQLQGYRPDIKQFGVDFSQIAVQRTREYGFEAAQCFLPNIPYSEHCFDTLVCTEVMEHLDDPQASAREFFRVLKPGGLLIVSVPKDMGPDHCAEHVQDFTAETIAQCLSGAGFEIDSVEEVIREPQKNNGASFVVVAKSKSVNKSDKNSLVSNEMTV